MEQATYNKLTDEEVWLRAYLAAGQHPIFDPMSFADACLAGFKIRFRQEE